MATPTNSIRLRVVRDVVQLMTLEEKEQLRNELALEIDQVKANARAGLAEHPQSSTAHSADNDDVLHELDQLIREAAAAGPALADSADALAEIRR